MSETGFTPASEAGNPDLQQTDRLRLLQDLDTLLGVLKKDYPLPIQVKLRYGDCEAYVSVGSSQPRRGGGGGWQRQEKPKPSAEQVEEVLTKWNTKIASVERGREAYHITTKYLGKDEWQELYADFKKLGGRYDPQNKVIVVKLQ